MREKLRRRWFRWWTDRTDFWPDQWEWLSDIIQRIGCAMFGHDPIPDMCGIPDHDYCAWCMKAMPGAAHE